MSPVSPRNVLVTGANRGIGLELVKQLTEWEEPPKIIFATYRNVDGAKNLFSLAEKNKNVRPIQFDVSDESSYPSLVEEISAVVGSQGLNLVIHNSGILPRPGTLDSSSRKEFLETYDVNAVAPFLLTRALRPLLKRAAVSGNGSSDFSWSRSAVLVVSALWGSTTANTNGGVPYAYGMSKAAVNFASRALSIDLKSDKILVVAIHPGWVQTDMGGSDANLTTQESVTQVLSSLSKMNVDNTGGFYNYDGRKLDY